MDLAVLIDRKTTSAAELFEPTTPFHMRLRHQNGLSPDSHVMKPIRAVCYGKAC